MRARIAHNDIDAAESMDDTANQRGYVFRLAQVGHKTLETLGARRADRRHRRVETAFVAPANRDHAAFRRELPGGRKPYPACSPGDERNFSGQAEIHAGL